MNLLRIIALPTVLAFTLNLSSQNTDPHQIIDVILEKQKNIPDYEVVVEIKVDVDFIKMPVKTATLVYTQPDDIKIKSDDFLMLPKRGLSQSILDLTKGGYDAMITGSEFLSGKDHWIIKVIPLVQEEIILSTLWVDKESYLISRAENFSKTGGKYLVDITYYEQIGLPQQIQVTFEVKEFKLPLDMVNRSIEIDKEKINTDELKTGSIYLSFREYRFNSDEN